MHCPKCDKNTAHTDVDDTNPPEYRCVICGTEHYKIAKDVVDFKARAAGER